jgi:hypothetical protein
MSTFDHPIQQTLHNTGINYNNGTGDIVETECGGLPIEIHAIGAVVTTAFVTTTDIRFDLYIKDTDRTTEDTECLTVTIPNGAAVGDVIITPSEFSPAGQSLRVKPGGTFTIACGVDGVGSAGVAKPFVLWRYAPAGNGDNVTETEE